MNKIWHLIFLLLLLSGCGGGGGSGGSNPNQQTLVTTAGSSVILPISSASQFEVSGGVPPYRVANRDQAIAVGAISGKILTIGAVSAGSTSLLSMDNSASISINGQIGSSSCQVLTQETR